MQITWQMRAETSSIDMGASGKDPLSDGAWSGVRIYLVHDTACDWFSTTCTYRAAVTTKGVANLKAVYPQDCTGLRGSGIW